MGRVRRKQGGGFTRPPEEQSTPRRCCRRARSERHAAGKPAHDTMRNRPPHWGWDAIGRLRLRSDSHSFHLAPDEAPAIHTSAGPPGAPISSVLPTSELRGRGGLLLRVCPLLLNSAVGFVNSYIYRLLIGLRSSGCSPDRCLLRLRFGDDSTSALGDPPIALLHNIDLLHFHSPLLRDRSVFTERASVRALPASDPGGSLPTPSLGC